MGSDFNFTKDMNTVSQVANMVREGQFSCETDLYAFYVQDSSTEDLTVRVFSDASACYEAMFELALNGATISDTVCLMSVAKGEVDPDALEGDLLKLLADEQGATFGQGLEVPPMRVGLLTEGEQATAAKKASSFDVRTFSGFAWKDGDAVRAYSNAYLPHAWRNWRDKQKQGFAVSPLLRKTVAIKGAPVSTYRTQFERELCDWCAAEGDFS